MKILQSPWTAILFVSAGRLIFARREHRILIRRTFKSNDFNSFLINSLKIFRLKTVQATRANMGSDNLLDGLPSNLIQVLKRT